MFGRGGNAEKNIAQALRLGPRRAQGRARGARDRRSRATPFFRARYCRGLTQSNFTTWRVDKNLNIKFFFTQAGGSELG